MGEDLVHARIWARDWLFQSALPYWWEVGADQENGGFHEKVGQDGVPILVPKRLRVQARQVFVYAEAGRIGWHGPWRDAIAHGLDYLLSEYRRSDGFYRTSVAGGGRAGSDSIDLYDQAFVLLALASAFQFDREPRLLAEALRLLDLLGSALGHPIAGFEEASPRRLPLCSNPHMHMLEAMLTWMQLEADDRFAEKAREIARLALDHLIDHQTGSIGEYYDGSWRLAPGAQGLVREPGHQYEWAHLLSLAGPAFGLAVADPSKRLLNFAETHGLRNGLAIFSIDPVGQALDGSARLWAQTERLRAMLRLSDNVGPAVSESWAAVRRFLDVPIIGLWTDRVAPDGTWLDEPAPASSLYHIVTAFVSIIEHDVKGASRDEALGLAQHPN